MLIKSWKCHTAFIFYAFERSIPLASFTRTVMETRTILEEYISKVEFNRVMHRTHFRNNGTYHNPKNSRPHTLAKHDYHSITNPFVTPLSFRSGKEKKWCYLHIPIGSKLCTNSHRNVTIFHGYMHSPWTPTTFISNWHHLGQDRVTAQHLHKQQPLITLW